VKRTRGHGSPRTRVEEEGRGLTSEFVCGWGNSKKGSHGNFFVGIAPSRHAVESRIRLALGAGEEGNLSGMANPVWFENKVGKNKVC